jgi:hypothetical protein
MRVRKGDKVTIPAGFLKMSFDPGMPGTLTKHGVQWLIKHFILGGFEHARDDFDPALPYYKDFADKVLKASPLLRDLDLDNERDAQTAWERIQEDFDTREGWAVALGTYCGFARDAVEQDDMKTAMWAAQGATNSHAMLVLRDENIQEALSLGYLGIRAAYGATEAAKQYPAEAKTFEAVKPLFEKLDEATLHTWFDTWFVDGLPIGPRIGVSDIPEETLRALAGYFVKQREQQKEEQRKDRQERREVTKLRLQGAGLGLAGVSAISGMVWAVIRMFLS